MRAVEAVKATVRGAGAGVIATLPMTAVVWAANGPRAEGRRRRELPPTRITRALARRARRRGLPRVPLRPATVALHFGYGAVMGALFGLLAARSSSARAPASRLARGVSFGLAVYAASYAGWVPAARILPPPRRDRPLRQGSLVAAHVVYGSVLGALG